jgi:hypothetical protein
MGHTPNRRAAGVIRRGLSGASMGFFRQHPRRKEDKGEKIRRKKLPTDMLVEPGKLFFWDLTVY